MRIDRGSKGRCFFLAAAFSIGFGFISHAAAQERTYLIDLNKRTATELGNLGGGWSRARALNDSGQVVGESSTLAGGYHAFITGPNGKGMRDLGTWAGRPAGPQASTIPGRWWGSPIHLEAPRMLL